MQEVKADIINLRRFKKNKARTKAEETAAANRLAYGRSKAEKEKSAALQRLEDQRLDGHRLDSKKT